jgi:hypothetical protein
MKPNFNLEDLKRENVYNVPENYFDKLPNRIMQRVTATPPETSGAKSWLPAPVRLALAGSGFAAVFATVFLLNFSQTDQTFTGRLAAVPETEIVNYLLASEQLDRSDLALFPGAETDLTYEFISASQTEIKQELEDQPLDEL